MSRHLLDLLQSQIVWQFINLPSCSDFHLRQLVYHTHTHTHSFIIQHLKVKLLNNVNMFCLLLIMKWNKTSIILNACPILLCQTLTCTIKTVNDQCVEFSCLLSPAAYYLRLHSCFIIVAIQMQLKSGLPPSFNCSIIRSLCLHWP